MSDFYYITQADVEAYLGVDLTPNGIATFELMQPLLQDAIDTYCNRSWNFENPVEETFDISDGTTGLFYVKYPDISAINSISVDGSAIDLTTISNNTARVKFTPYGSQTVVISYNSAAAQNPPKAIKLAFIQWMARMIQTAPDAGRDVAQTQAGTVSVRYAQDKQPDMPDFVRMVLDKYRLPPIDRF